MRRALLFTLATLILASASVAYAHASVRWHPGVPPRIAPLRLILAAGHARTACTRPLPDSWGTTAVWVHANGRDLQSASAGGWSVYYAGNGTLVRLVSYPHGGPVCVKATTWLPRVRVLVTFRVL